MSDDWEEVELRPWAAARNRVRVGCQGEDFCKFRRLVRMQLLWSPSRKELRGTAEFTKFVEGPPGRAHGASIAMVFDEILAYPVWRLDTPAVTAELSVSYKAAVPLGSTARFHCWVKKKTGRKWWLEAELTDQEQKKVYARGRALFISIKYARMHQRSFL